VTADGSRTGSGSVIAEAAADAEWAQPWQVCALMRFMDRAAREVGEWRAYLRPEFVQSFARIQPRQASGCVNRPMLLPGSAADDAALVSAAREGEAAAFEQLFDRYHAMIHTFAYRLCLRAADADDIAQATFIKAARGLPAFHGGDFRSWLYRIAANCARDLHRDAARRARLEREGTEQMLADSATRNVDAAAVSDALATNSGTSSCGSGTRCSRFPSTSRTAISSPSC